MFCVVCFVESYLVCVISCIVFCQHQSRDWLSLLFLLSVAFVTICVCFADTNVASSSLSNVDDTNTASQSSAGNLQMLSI